MSIDEANTAVSQLRQRITELEALNPGPDALAALETMRAENTTLRTENETLRTLNATLRTTADTAESRAQRAIAAAGVKVPIAVQDPERVPNGKTGIHRAMEANVAQQAGK